MASEFCRYCGIGPVIEGHECMGTVKAQLAAAEEVRREAEAERDVARTLLREILIQCPEETSAIVIGPTMKAMISKAIEYAAADNLLYAADQHLEYHNRETREELVKAIADYEAARNGDSHD